VPSPRLAVVVLLLAAPWGAARAAVQDAPAPAPAPAVAPSADSVPPQRPALAVGQALFVNVLVNRFDAWALREHWAIGAGTGSWRRNLRLGWEWDEDNFTTNMFAHPYHGGLYFNTGRANGLDYWESAPLAFLGSWTWEYLGETYRPSLNDFFMTSFGGIALGEMFHRLGASIRDNTARGGGRLRRELVALPLDPIGGLNRLLRGQWSAVFPNPPEHDHGAFLLRVHLGARFAEGVVVDSAARLGTLVFDLVYGDPFLRPYTSPFDAFGMRAVISTGGGFNVLRASGRLYGRDLTDRAARVRHVLAINQRYDYVRNPAHSIGGQSVEIGIYSRWPLGGDFGVRTAAFGDGVILGAIDAPGAGLGERNYDFGPGAGFRLEAGLERRGVRYLTLHSRIEYVHAVSGASADHTIWFTGAELTLPIARSLGVAAHATYFTRLSRYTDRPDDRRDYPELRLLAVWTRAGLPTR
jgi:hypothetical protein